MSFHDKGIGYYIPPNLRDFGKGAYDLFKEIRPFNPENLPTYDFDKTFKRNLLDMAVDTGILGLDFATLGTASIPRGIALKVADEAVEAATKKPVITASNRLRSDGKFAGSVGKEIDITNSKIAEVLENIRTGKIEKGDAAFQIDEIVGGKSGLVTSQKTRTKTGFTEKFDNIYKNYLDSTKNTKDIFNTEIYRTGRMGRQEPVSASTKSNILEAIKIADADTSSVSYAVKFRNALSNFYKPVKNQFSAADEIEYPYHQPYQIQIGKDILKFLGRDPEDLTMVRKGKFSTTSSAEAWDNIKVGEIVTDTKAKTTKLRNVILFDDTGKNFDKIKAEIKNNKVISDKLSQIKNLFKDPETALAVDLDHIQAPRFGGTNAESNLRFIPRGDHVAIKSLTPEKTNAFNIVKAKTGFEDEIYKKSTKIVDLIKQGKIEEATKLSSEIKTTVDGFKNTYKNTDFVVGQPYVAKKTGEKTAEYITYADSLKLSTDQKNLVQKLLPTYSNLPNANQTIEQSVEAVYNNYAQIYSLIGKIPNKLVSEMSGGLREGGIVSMKYMTRPLDGQR